MEKNMQLTANVQRVSLESLFGAAYDPSIAAKSAVGRENPNHPLAPTHALACFFVGKTCTHAYLAVWLFVYVRNSNPSSMAVRAGQLSGWPVSKVTGFSPLFGLPPMSVRTPSGGNNLLTLEAAIMATTPSTRLPEVQIINGVAVTSSLVIADYFGKRHDNVIRSIQTLECSPEFNALNFEAVEYSDPKGEKRPCYTITRDGFTFLAMSFTGKRAAAFKEAYIKAFNQMEAKIYMQNLVIPDFYDHAATAKGLLGVLHQLRKLTNEHVCPMLEAANSPLAPRIYSLVNESVFITQLLQGRASK